jgi:AcrR family transcriptional regulator
MAKRAKSAAARGRAARAAKTSDAELSARILEAAMALAAEQGWRAVTPEAIAARTDIAASDVARICPDRAAVLKALAAHADAAVASGTSDQDEPRDRIFDAVMKRFDALQPYRKGIAAALKGQIGDPRGAVMAACALRQSMIKTLEAAGVDTSGLFGALRVKGLSAIYLDVMRSFVEDDSADLGKTMAALDKRLKFVDRIVGAISGLGLGAKSAA